MKASTPQHPTQPTLQVSCDSGDPRSHYIGDSRQKVCVPGQPARQLCPGTTSLDQHKQPARHKPLPPTGMTLRPPTPGPTLQVLSGNCVPKSQNLTVVSPEPLASLLPSGLKLTDSTASEWPDIDAVHRATGRTLNTAWGWYTMRRAFSTETCSRQQ